MSQRDEEAHLKGLTEEYLVALELDQHEKVSRLSAKICVCLVDAFERDLKLEQTEDDEDQPSYDDFHGDRLAGDPLALVRSAEWRYLNEICLMLKQSGKIASSYGKVSDFVRIHDMVCLGNLLGAVGSRKSCEIELRSDKVEIRPDFSESASILRHSMALLRSMKQIKRPAAFPSSWFDQAKVSRQAGTIGFTIYKIDLSDQIHLLKNPKETNTGGCFHSLEELDSLNLKKFSLFRTLKSRWFKQFHSRALDSPYPVDRFTILIAIWLIGHKCGHYKLEQIMSQLVDSIYHQEANTCNEEDLLQLSQIGSIWLTHLRGYRSNKLSELSMSLAARSFEMAKGDNMYELDDMDDDDGSFEGSDFEHSNSLASGTGDRNQDDAMAKLRQLIDTELLLGERKCPLCADRGHQAIGSFGTSLEPQGCSNCGFDQWQECCAISMQPLKLATINMLTSIRPQLLALMLVCPNEWLRALIRVKRPKAAASSVAGDAHEQLPDERVDISDKFQRLTLTRNEDIEIQSNASSDNGSIELSPQQESVSRDPPEVCRRMLSDYMRFRLAEQPTSGSSETLQMLNFCPKSSELLPVNSVDLLLTDQMDFEPEVGELKPVEPVELSLRLDCSKVQDIYACCVRSARSQLPLGCNRKFNWLELVCLTGSNGSSPRSLVCPYCEQQLIKLTSLVGD